MKLLIIAMVLLAGCTAVKFNDGRRAELVGKPVDGFIAANGQPTRTQANNDGSQILSWDRRQEFSGLYGTHGYNCEVNIAVAANGIVSDYYTRGTGCRP